MQIEKKTYEMENIRSFVLPVCKDDLNYKSYSVLYPEISENIAVEKFDELVQIFKSLEFQFIYLPFNFYSHPKFHKLISIVKKSEMTPIFEVISKNLSFVVSESHKHFERDFVIFNFLIDSVNDLARSKDFHDLKNLNFCILNSEINELKSIIKIISHYKIKKAHYLHKAWAHFQPEDLTSLFEMQKHKGIELKPIDNIDYCAFDDEVMDCIRGVEAVDRHNNATVELSVVIDSNNNLKEFNNTLLSFVNQTIPKKYYELIILDYSCDGRVREKKLKALEALPEKLKYKVINIDTSFNLKNKKYKGLFKNIGVLNAEGEKIIFVESGAIVDLQIIEETLIKLDYWDLIQFNIQKITSASLVLESLNFENLKQRAIGVYDGDSGPLTFQNWDRISEKWQHISSGVLALNKKTFKKMGWFRSFKMGEGFDFLDFAIRTFNALTFHKSDTRVYCFDKQEIFNSFLIASQNGYLASENEQDFVCFNKSPSFVLFLSNLKQDKSIKSQIRQMIKSLF